MDPRTQARQIKSRLGVVPQIDNLDTELTVRENLEMYARYFDIPGEIFPQEGPGAARVRPARRAGKGPGRAAVGRHEAPPDDRARPHQRPRTS